MAKQENKNLEQIAPVVVQTEPELPDELKFICAICAVAQNKKNTKAECSELRIKGTYCEKLERLRVKILTLDRENENHRKYIKAFMKKPYYTEDEMKGLYNNTFETKTPMSFEEFLDYCRIFGFVIV